jgi:PERQ amino acid-rich with GYF domain-containing protein
MLRRNAAGISSGNGPSSPWSASPQTAGLSPMGAFGSFTLGGPPGQPMTPGEKKAGFGSLRGESRFSKLMSKDSAEELSGGLKEKSSITSLGKLSEAETEHPPGNRTSDGQFSRPVSSSTDPFGDEAGQSGSGALGGGQDMGPIHQPNAPGLGTPARQISRNDFGFSSLGEPSGIGGLRELNMQQRRDQLQHQVPQPQHHSALGDNEPLSPTETNPYQSPVPERADSEDIDAEDLGFQNIHHPGTGGMTSNQGMSGYGSQPRTVPAAGFEGAGSDRSQTSSTGASKGFPTLSGLGGLSSLGNWPSTSAPGGPGLVGTPQKERSSFGAPFSSSSFSGLADIHSPSSNNIGGIFGTSNTSVPGATGTVGRSRRLASLFPPAMQAQMQTSGDVGRSNEDDAIVEGGQGPTSHGRGATRNDTDSPLRSGRGIFDELYVGDNGRSGADGFDNNLLERDRDVPGTNKPFTSGSMQPPLSATVAQGSLPQQNTQQTKNVTQSSQQTQTTHTSAPGAPPGQFQQQERTMVMPDRMRWVYKDVSGVMQGPFSGLEMHDWFKAGFFTPDLHVKKYEDNDYKPLGQIIRQIGNSREPFLVPQMGIAYGPPSNQENGQWGSGGATAAASNQPSQSGTVQPPFAGSFPSFGTTLTAEQQNNLERRKQEEQYLMARQREHLVQQQVIQKQVDAARMHALHGVHPVQQLHHHGSAHSLHSQPSFGSMTSPGGFQPTPPTIPVQMPHSVVPAFFDINAPLRPTAPGVLGAMGPTPEYINGAPMRDEEMSAMMGRMNFNRDMQLPFGPAPGPLPQQNQENQAHPQQVAAILAQRAQLSREQAQHDSLQQSNANDQALQANERLQQFHDLRAQIDDESSLHTIDQTFRHPFGTQGHPKPNASQTYTPSHRVGLQAHELIAKAQLPSPPAIDGYPHSIEPVEVPNTAQQAQPAVAAKQSSAAPSQQDTTWSKVDSSALPQPFPPPPQSISPLPAPTARKSGRILPDALNLEARSRTQTPSAETPSTTASVAPWARDAAEGTKGPSLKEIQEAEARKAAKAEEAAAAARRAQLQLELANQPQPPVPGLPPTSTWGTSPGVTPPSSAPSAWNKPLVKGNTVQGGASMKKSLSQIQKEEEAFARKQKAATASAANAANAVAAPISAGKRYADLASKPAQGPAQSIGGAWTTVGAGGKLKGPFGGATAAPPLRTSSSGPAPTFNPTTKLRPVATPVRSSTLGGPLPAQPSASDEFTKWAKGALSKGLNKTINGTQLFFDFRNSKPDY